MVFSVQALASMGYELGAGKMALISSSQPSLTSFLAQATTLGIRVPEILELVPRQLNIGTTVGANLSSPQDAGFQTRSREIC